MHSFLLILTMFLTTFLTTYFTRFLDKNTEEYYKNRTHKYPKIYDIGHKYLPNLTKYEYISHLYVLFFSIFFLLPNIFKEFVGFIIPIFLIRLITIHLTILPKNEECNIDNEFKVFGGCYDKIFSGHFSVVFLITLLLQKHKYISLLWAFILNIINILLILTTRSHYIIDIVVAFFVTLFIYQNDFTLFRFLKNLK